MRLTPLDGVSCKRLSRDQVLGFFRFIMPVHAPGTSFAGKVCYICGDPKVAQGFDRAFG
jgi:hypothetical protein